MRQKLIKKRLNPRSNLKNYDKIRKTFSWSIAEQEIEFFGKGKKRKLNAAHNAVDRHAESWRKNKIALYWVGEDRQNNLVEKNFTFKELSEISNRFANVLTKNGVRKGDRVFLFLPRIPEIYTSFLGILKTGAIAGTLFAAFGTQGLYDRLENSGAKIVVTTPELKPRLDKIRKMLPCLKKVILILGKENKRNNEMSYEKEMQNAATEYKTKHMKPEERAYMLYTSGTTGKPKGVVHTHHDIVYQHITAKWILDLKEDDVYWCTADPGWVTGIAYGILGQWSNGIASVVDNRKFSAENWYSLIEKYKVTVWYTAPTAVRMMMKEGKISEKFKLKSLRHICSVGEPLNPEAVFWGLKAFGLPIHDNYWQTETGGIVIANYPSLDIKPGSMGKPFPGIKAAVVNDNFREIRRGEEGNLVLKPNWPSLMKEIWKNSKKYNEYFKKGWYITGDKALIDNDGYFWFVGRADDVIKTAGHRVGPFEVESALMEYPAVAEAGVIGKPDKIYGEIIKAFVSLNKGFKPTEKLKEKIRNFIKKQHAGHAYPKEIEFVQTLPKTRSGKIMRRVLKCRELGLPIGDVSTLEK